MFFDLRKGKKKKNVIEDESSGNDRCFIKRERMNELQKVYKCK